MLGVLVFAGPVAAQLTPPKPSRVILPSEHLMRVWKKPPEWLVMALDLFAGGQVAATDGWYRVNSSKIRHDWAETLRRFDRNGDGYVARDEIPLPDTDFARLDRDHSGRLNPEDLEFPKNSLARARSKIIMSFADADRDGRLAESEFNQAIFMAKRDNFTLHMYFADSVGDLEKEFASSAKAGMPFMALGDFQEIVDRNAIRYAQPIPPRPDDEFDRARRETLLLAFARRDLGSCLEGPSLEAPAPDFSLPDVDSEELYRLADHIGSKPIVLIFGSLSNPHFRTEAGNLAKLQHRYGDRAEFRFIYGRESHTTDGWRLPINDQANLKITQPTTSKDRTALAKYCRAKLNLKLPTSVDTMDDRVWSLYSGGPTRLYLIDRAGRIAYKGARGPFGFKVGELEQSLILELASDTEGGAGKDR
jgi:hypothetical protein